MEQTDICFSIGIPVYNKAPYLERCLKSVCGQTYPDLQIILVDDGSTDDSGAILDAWSKRDERITVIHQSNSGAAAARNTAIKQANGDYMMFVDADDTIAENLCEAVARKLRECDSDCVIFECSIATEQRQWNPCHSEKQWTWRTGNADFYKKMFGPDAPLIGTSACNKAFRMSVIRDHDICFPPQKIGEDMQFCLRFAWESERWDRINAPMYCYYQNTGSVMHDFDPKFEENIRVQMLSVEEFAKARGIFEELEPAICCVQLRDCLTMCRYIYGTAKNNSERMNRLRGFITEPFFRERVLRADTALLDKKYKVFYTILKYQMTYSLFLMMKVYMRGYR